MNKYKLNYKNIKKDIEDTFNIIIFMIICLLYLIFIHFIVTSIISYKEPELQMFICGLLITLSLSIPTIINIIKNRYFIKNV